jgi:deazaflavin-dependent oxidoreductase (nitroreductase family)
MKLIHITTTGKKTGKKRVTELYTFEHEGEYVIIASNGGRQNHPDWYFNLLNDPGVHVKIGKNEFDATARVSRAPLREKLWAALVELSPHYAEFQHKTERTIPVILLKPAK